MANKKQKRPPGQSSSAPMSSKEQKGPQERSQAYSQGFSHGKTINTGYPVMSTASAPSGAGRGTFPPCLYCGKMHPGECKRVTEACFRCGSKSHLVDDSHQTQPMAPSWTVAFT